MSNNIIIFEDDLVLHHLFEKHFTHILTILPNDFDILLLSYNFDCNWVNLCNL